MMTPVAAVGPLAVGPLAVVPIAAVAVAAVGCRFATTRNLAASSKVGFAALPSACLRRTQSF